MQLAPIPKQFMDSSGVPYSHGTVEVFLTGSTEKANVYDDSDGKILIQNPIELDSHGAWKGFVDSEAVLDYVVKSREGNVVFFFPHISVIQRGSIGRFSFKNASDLVPDKRFLEFRDFAGDVVVTFNKSLREWLKNNGFEFED